MRNPSRISSSQRTISPSSILTSGASNNAFSPPEKQRFKVPLTIERSNSHLKDRLIPLKIMVRRPDKFACCLMTSVLCLATIKILQYCILQSLQKKQRSEIHNEEALTCRGTGVPSHSRSTAFLVLFYIRSHRLGISALIFSFTNNVAWIPIYGERLFRKRLNINADSTGGLCPLYPIFMVKRPNWQIAHQKALAGLTLPV